MWENGGWEAAVVFGGMGLGLKMAGMVVCLLLGQSGHRLNWLSMTASCCKGVIIPNPHKAQFATAIGGAHYAAVAGSANEIFPSSKI